MILTVTHMRLICKGLIVVHLKLQASKEKCKTRFPVDSGLGPQKKREMRFLLSFFSHQGHFVSLLVHVTHAMCPHSNASFFCASMHTWH